MRIVRPLLIGMFIVVGSSLPQAGASGNPTDGNYPAGVSGAHYPGGCPINGLRHGLTYVYQCLQVGQNGNGGIGDPYYEGIEVAVNSVQYKPGITYQGTQYAFQAPGEVLVDATVKNADYHGGITAGNWWVASYDSQWQGAQTSYGGNLLSPSKDELTTKCSNLSKCNFWEIESAYTCGNLGLNEALKPPDLKSVKDVVTTIASHVEQKQWQELKKALAEIGIDVVGKTPAELKAAAEEVTGFLDNCVDAIVGIAPGEENTGILTFDAQVYDSRNRKVDLATPGHNIGIIWYYGGTGLEWVCKVNAKNGCQRVGALKTPVPQPTTTTSSTPAGACTAANLATDVKASSVVTMAGGLGPDQYDVLNVHTATTDADWAVFDVQARNGGMFQWQGLAPGGGADFSGGYGFTNCQNGHWNVVDAGWSHIGCDNVPSDILDELISERGPDQLGGPDACGHGA